MPPFGGEETKAQNRGLAKWLRGEFRFKPFTREGSQKAAVGSRDLRRGTERAGEVGVAQPRTTVGPGALGACVQGTPETARPVAQGAGDPAPPLWVTEEQRPFGRLCQPASPAGSEEAWGAGTPGNWERGGLQQPVLDFFCEANMGQPDYRTRDGIHKEGDSLVHGYSRKKKKKSKKLANPIQQYVK